MSTYLMSYPGTDWHIRGGENFRSRMRPEANPRRAMGEWLTLADAILRAGGHVLVMPPPAVDPPLTGMVYTAGIGQIFGSHQSLVFLLARMSVAHRQGESDFASSFVAEAGLRTAFCLHPWEGQADLQLLAGNRYIASWGVRSQRSSLDDLRPLLQSGAHLIDVELREPFFHGNTCLDPITNRAGDTVLLAHGGALVNSSLEGLRQAVGKDVEVYPIDVDDALNLACHSLCVNGTLIMPAGLSSALRGHLIRRGFMIEELELPELQGKGGGGPRALVNELRGLVPVPGAPDYASMRDELRRAAEDYPATPTPAALLKPQSDDEVL